MVNDKCHGKSGWLMKALARFVKLNATCEFSFY